MQAGLRRYRFEPVAELTLQAVEQDLAPRGVFGTHASHVAREVPLADERREHGLRERVAMRVGAFLDGDERVARPRRRDDEPLAQGREQALGERADIEDERIAV